MSKRDPNKPKKPGPTVDEDEATLQLIAMVHLWVRERTTMLPITIKSVKRLKALLGIKSMETSPAGGVSHCYWLLPESMALYLQRAGIDPRTGICVDRAKYQLALLEHDQAVTAKLEEKYVGQDAKARTEAIRKVLELRRPCRAPKVAPPAHYLHNHYLNQKITNHLIESQQEEEELNGKPPAPATSVRKKICGPLTWESDGLTL